MRDDLARETALRPLVEPAGRVELPGARPGREPDLDLERVEFQDDLDSLTIRPREDRGEVVLSLLGASRSASSVTSGTSPNTGLAKGPNCKSTWIFFSASQPGRTASIEE